MDGIVDLDDLRFRWELRDVPRGPARCTLHVAFGELGIARPYAARMTREEAQREAARLVPELLRRVN